MKKMLALLLLGLLQSAASACSCAFSTVDDYVHNADTIYMATLVEARLVPGDYPDTWPSLEGKFKVGKILKGKADGSIVTLSTGTGHGDCGVAMVVPAAYIIFKNKESQGIDICSGTSTMESFQVDEVANKITAAVKRAALKNRPK